MKTGAHTSGGSGLLYRGPFVYAVSSSGALSLESVAVPCGRLTPSGPRYHVTDHLGSVVAVVDGSSGASLTDFGARHYSPALRRWLTPDPLCENYYDTSPYVYCDADPVNIVDPFGEDYIYATSLLGFVRRIGEDEKETGTVYLVRGRIKRDVIRQMKAKGVYSGDLSVSSEVMHIPSRAQMEEVMDSYYSTLSSKIENGGHAKSGYNDVSRWDQGSPAQIVYNDSGSMVFSASITPFMKNGLITYPATDSIDYYWHIHPNIVYDDFYLGDSEPSERDKEHYAKMVSYGFKATAFIIGARTNRVSFYNEQGAYKTIRLKQFFKIMTL